MSATTETPPAGADPSMEDILASIRRILSEEDVPETAAAEAKPAPEDVLVLDASMLVTDEPVSAAVRPDTAAELLAALALPAPAIEEPAPPAALPRAVQPPVALPMQEPIMRAETDELTSGLTSPETQAAAVSSVSSLMRALSAGRSTSVYHGGPTITDLVREEIRPVLKDWLDTYLPPLVEGMVRAEIERVIARGTA